MAFILYMVAQATMRNVDLEADNYYQQEIQYQDRVDALNNALGMESKFTLTQETENLVVAYPEELRGAALKGNLHFFKPDNSSLDRQVEMSVGQDGKQAVALNNLGKGVYVLKISWAEAGKDYYVEKSINIH